LRRSQFSRLKPTQEDETMRPIYLDHNASTPIAPQVGAVMREVMKNAFGNPSSLHWAGVPARQIVDKARGQIAELLGCSAEEIVFTSGGSEADNLALKGMFFASKKTRPHIITTCVEHPAIIEPCRFLKSLGAQITWLPVDGTGRIDADDLRRAITTDTILISIMHANGEVGTIEPIEECAHIAREHGVALHTDAAQSMGKIATRVDELGVDLLSMAGHKFYAPKGIGALFVRKGLVLEPLIHGGGHESGRRSGTESAVLSAALGEACVLAADRSDLPRIARLRDRFWDELRDRFGGLVSLNGHPEHRLPNTLNVSFRGHVGADILAQIEPLAASTGSACHEGRVELSPVLEAMGVAPQVGMGALRFSLGRATSDAEIDYVLDALSNALA
jgi:cysteine desulfurase